jgi:3-hydroxyisobutyrate dehydrogenase-like beta-hydroxyacid dehydrogenase
LPLVEKGAKTAATAREAVGHADVIVTSLMDDKSILENLQGQDGILAGMQKGAVHVCVTTISPDCADELVKLHKEHGSHYVSGPVVGRPDSAASGQLITYLAGHEKAIETVIPVCNAYTIKAVPISDEPRVANCMKLCINFNAVSIIELIGETYVLAEKCGIPLTHLRDFYQQSAFAHPAFKLYAEKLRARDFGGRGGFVMTGGLKDVTLMRKIAAQVGAPLEVSSIIERKLKAGIEAGMQDTDWSAFYEITRKEAGLQ